MASSWLDFRKILEEKFFSFNNAIYVSTAGLVPSRVFLAAEAHQRMPNSPVDPELIDYIFQSSIINRLRRAGRLLLIENVEFREA